MSLADDLLVSQLGTRRPIRMATCYLYGALGLRPVRLVPSDQVRDDHEISFKSVAKQVRYAGLQ
jgi:hypothetical protein